MVKVSTDPRVAEQLSWESARRTRLGVPSIAGGVIYLLSAILISSILSGAPTVGVFQGIAPALEGKANPSVSPRAPEVKYLEQHSTSLILGGVIAALAIGLLTLILVFLMRAVQFRNPRQAPTALYLVIAGGTLVALTNVADWIVKAVLTHNFVSGHDYTNHAVEQVMLKGTANYIVAYLGLLAGLTLCVGMFMSMFAAMRVGLIPRWVAYVGMFSALLFILSTGAAELEIIPAFWMCAVGILYMGRWPGGDPPAWAAGEARPWPTQSELRAERAARQGGARGGRAQP